MVFGSRCVSAANALSEPAAVLDERTRLYLLDRIGQIVGTEPMPAAPRAVMWRKAVTNLPADRRAGLVVGL